jgi:hypothetical protein
MGSDESWLRDVVNIKLQIVVDALGTFRVRVRHGLYKPTRRREGRVQASLAPFDFTQDALGG